MVPVKKKSECFEGRSWRNSRPEERFEAVLSSISDGVFAVDNHLRIACFNRAAAEITGWGKNEVLGRRYHDVLHTGASGDDAMAHTMATGEPVTDRATGITAKDGQVIPVSISTSLLRDKQGRIAGGVGTFRDLRLMESLRRQVKKRYIFEDIVGKSDAMQRVFDMLPAVAVGDSTVLLQGESGTGKELVARALHNLSDRKDRPFITVNCGALPSELLESELFGYKAGAFTGAHRDKPGRIARAEGGTLFLDEIGDLPLAMQVKLLRFLQEKTYEPLGGTTVETADVRIVSATNRDVAAMVAEKTFRQDLYYRLNVIGLTLPPLRDREGDVPLLAEHFLDRFNALRKKRLTGFSSRVMGALLTYRYPGNIRELENIVEHAFVLCPAGIILPEHLPAAVQGGPPAAEGAVPSTLEESERAFLIRMLAQHGYNRLATAKSLGIHKTTLHRKMRRLGITTPGMDGRNGRGTGT